MLSSVGRFEVPVWVKNAMRSMQLRRGSLQLYHSLNSRASQPAASAPKLLESPSAVLVHEGQRV